VRSFSPQTLLADLNGGKGMRTETGVDLQVTRRDGTTFQVDLSGLATVQDVIDAINAADGGGGVAAGFDAATNGIRLDDATGGAGTLRVEGVNFSLAAADLGLDVPAAGNTLIGRDVNSIESNGLLSNLLKLHDALARNDESGITSAAETIQADLDRVVRTRGQVGAQVQDFEARQDRVEGQKLALEAMLSELEDVDYNEAVTRFALLQTALQANMQSTGQILNMSLLDFLG
jgi:flagellin-like hook-associated protein FlgL